MLTIDVAKNIGNPFCDYVCFFYAKVRLEEFILIDEYCLPELFQIGKSTGSNLNSFLNLYGAIISKVKRRIDV